MNVIDLIFLAAFIVCSALLFIFGILSFALNYLKFLTIKSGVNSNKLMVSENLKKTINSPFWVYRIFVSSKLMDEITELVMSTKELNVIHLKYKYFLMLALLSLFTLIILFTAYIAGNILISWFI